MIIVPMRGDDERNMILRRISNGCQVADGRRITRGRVNARVDYNPLPAANMYQGAFPETWAK
jgi:hypothetical protein